jgi:hypothetical protein
VAAHVHADTTEEANKPILTDRLAVENSVFGKKRSNNNEVKGVMKEAKTTP